MHHHTTTTDPQEFWDELYGARPQLWSGNPNATLVELVEGLPPGSVLDLGSGEGGDSVWFASRGWTVTGVDISPTALERSAALATRDGVAARIKWERHDLAESFPDGSFDLVSALFLHSPLDFPRDAVLRRAADAVAIDGRLVIVGHAGYPSWAQDPDPDMHFPTPAEVVAALRLPDGASEIELAELRTRTAKSPDGEEGELDDSIVLLHRLA